jgi:hypothetical protein
MFGRFLGCLIAVEVLTMDWLVNFKKSVMEENLEFSDEAMVESLFGRMIATASQAAAATMPAST